VAAGRGDPLLQLAHLVGQRRLVADRRGHPAEQRGHLGAGLGEPEDVVDEQQHVLLLHVAEVLGHGEGRQADAQTGARRLVHLAEHQRGVVDDAGLGHLQEQVVALAGPLPHPGEHRHAAEVLGHPADHLLDQHGLAHAGPAEQPDLPAQHVRGQQVEDLDASGEHLGPRLELVQRRGVAVDRPPLGDVQGGGGHVERLPEGVEHVPLGDITDRHLDRRAGVGHLGAAHQAVRGLHGDRAHEIVAQVLLHLQRQQPRVVADRHLGVQRVVDFRHLVRGEFDVHDGADDPRDTAGARSGFAALG